MGFFFFCLAKTFVKKENNTKKRKNPKKKKENTQNPEEQQLLKVGKFSLSKVSCICLHQAVQKLHVMPPVDDEQPFCCQLHCSAAVLCLEQHEWLLQRAIALPCTQLLLLCGTAIKEGVSEGRLLYFHEFTIALAPQ